MKLESLRFQGSLRESKTQSDKDAEAQRQELQAAVERLEQFATQQAADPINLTA